jgi:hypothetical protein
MIDNRLSCEEALERLREIAYGKPDLFITADSPPPHTKWVDQQRLRDLLARM